MKLWRKNKRAGRELPSLVKAGLVYFNQKLIQAANFLQQKTNSYSAARKKVLLLFFMVVFAAGSTVVIVRSLQPGKSAAINVSRIKTPTVETGENQTTVITKHEFFKIQKFKQYIDSLGSTGKGRKLKDSLLHNRPHLMDSVNFLVNLYLEQSKTLVK
jgi:hypothetical protein